LDENEEKYLYYVNPYSNISYDNLLLSKNSVIPYATVILTIEKNESIYGVIVWIKSNSYYELEYFNSSTDEISYMDVLKESIVFLKDQEDSNIFKVIILENRNVQMEALLRKLAFSYVSRFENEEIDNDTVIEYMLKENSKNDGKTKS
jgi:hypothetical protein